MKLIRAQEFDGWREKALRPLVRACLILGLSLLGGSAKAISGPQITKGGVIKIQGILLSIPGKGRVLKTAERDYQLEGQSAYLLHTLEDKRLLSREMRLVGAVQPDGSFQVQKIFTVRDGRLYRVQYYCNVCNIVAVEPGRCVCCQRPTKLQEIPVTNGDE